MVTLDVIYSTEKDTSNYVRTIYKGVPFKHGRDDLKGRLLSMLDVNLQNLIVNATDEEDAYNKIHEYLQKQSQEILEKIDKSKQNFQEAWNLYGEQSIKFLEYLYQQPFPFNNLIAYLTTNNICPYDYKEHSFYVRYKTAVPLQLRTAVHELNHFMFYHYYPDLGKDLGKEKYELLKESLTFFSNPELQGYPNEDDLRKLFLSRNWNSLKEAIEAGTAFLKSKNIA